MFGLFKKKDGEAPEEQERLRKDAAQEAGGGESPEARAFAAQFLPEELSVLAVTGPNPFAGGPREDGLWVASMGLTAWMEEDGPDLHREEIRLVTLADPRLLGFLRQRALPDFLIKFRARLSADGSQLLLLDLPQPGFDPDLKAILEEQKKPDSTYVRGWAPSCSTARWAGTRPTWTGWASPSSWCTTGERRGGQGRPPDRPGPDGSPGGTGTAGSGPTPPSSCPPSTPAWRTRCWSSRPKSWPGGWSRSPSRSGRTVPSSSGSTTPTISGSTPCGCGARWPAAPTMWIWRAEPMRIILASRSPRRQELLERMGLSPFDVIPARGEERADPALSPARLVEALSRQKAAEVAAAHPEALVIAADTVVSIDGLVLGKPHSEAEAAQMLARLSGREHTVYTGVTVRLGTGRIPGTRPPPSLPPPVGGGHRPLRGHRRAHGQGRGLRHPGLRGHAGGGHRRGLL